MMIRILLTIALGLILGPAQAAERPSTSPGAAARVAARGAMSDADLDAAGWAFRFATAIESDDADRGRAQAAVVLDLVEEGELERAAELAEAIDGWQRGRVLAELAAAAGRRARHGRHGESAADERLARAAAAEAREAAETSVGWERARVLAHVGSALAALGDTEEATRLAAQLAEADPRQYAGRAASLVAASLAASGEPMAALEALDEHDDVADEDVAWWRARGYLDLASSADVPPPLRRRAAESAEDALAGVHGWRRIHAATPLAASWSRLDEASRARRFLETIEAELDALPPGDALHVPLDTELARAWAITGERRRARALLDRAEATFEAVRETRPTRSPARVAIQAIEEPGLLARMASARAASGDESAARRLFAEALRVSATLTNARPRALAVVATCRELARVQVELDPTTRRRLARLHAELGPPW